MQNYLSKRFPSLESKDFRLFLVSQLLSNIGTQMQLVAISWHIYELTKSPLALGLVGLLRFLPILALCLIGGSVADSHNRKKILYICELMLMALSLILAFTTLRNTITPAVIFGITVLYAVVLSFEAPARQAFIPSLVNKKYLANGLSIGSIFFQVSMIIGPALSGILIGHSALGFIYLINAFSFLAVLLGLFLMDASGNIEGEKVTISLETVKEGINFVRSKTIIWSTMLLDFLSTFFASAIALLPIFATDILNVGPEKLGLLYSAQSVGAVIAGLVIANFHEIRRQGLIIIFSVILYAIGTILFGLSQTFIMSFLSLVLVGAGNSISTIIRNTIRQLETPDRLRGRMSSINMVFFLGGPQLGDFEAGLAASIIGARNAVISGGIATLIVASLIGGKIKTLRRYDKHVE